MAFQSVPNGVEVVFKATQNGIPVVNVYTVQDTTDHTEARLTEIGNTFFDWWQTNVRPGQVPSYILGQIVVTSLELATGPQVQLNFVTGNVGTASGSEMAANGALVVSWRTSAIGRSFRGRTYFGGLAQSSLTNAQTFTTGTVTGFATAGTALIDALNGIGAALAILSRVAAGVLRVTGLLTEVISVIVDNKVDSVRRRTAN